MAKYLRYIDYRLTDDLGRSDQEMCAVIGEAPETWRIGWMYQHYATPMRSDGVAKVNIYFTRDDVQREPGEILEIACVYETFDFVAFRDMAPHDRQRYFLDRYHHAMMRAAEHFGWDSQPLRDTYDRILAEDFRFAFVWKKPVTSPDRRCKVQAVIEVDLTANISLVFFDRRMQEQYRVLISRVGIGNGPVEFILHKIGWDDAGTVRITHKNRRDYWLCTTAGALTFHYPRADNGDAQAEYDLGRMYVDGLYVLQDKPRGLPLIRSSAAKGYKHAVNLLRRLEQDTVAML